jgi:hypothetical protein
MWVRPRLLQELSKLDGFQEAHLVTIMYVGHGKYTTVRQMVILQDCVWGLVGTIFLHSNGTGKMYAYFSHRTPIEKWMHCEKVVNYFVPAEKEVLEAAASVRSAAQYQPIISSLPWTNPNWGWFRNGDIDPAFVAALQQPSVQVLHFNTSHKLRPEVPLESFQDFPAVCIFSDC